MEDRQRPTVVSALAIRRAIGVLGVLLPVVLIGGDGLDVKSTISDYYGSPMVGIFVGTLVAIAVCLWVYKGYDRCDDLLGNVGAVLALGVALFPVIHGRSVEVAHYVAATGLFSVLALFCRQFRKTNSQEPDPGKTKRNRTYLASGWTIVVCMALIGVVNYYEIAPDSSPVFWLETLAIYSFAISWFSKGRTLLALRSLLTRS